MTLPRDPPPALVTTVQAALRAGGPVHAFLDEQRHRHVAAMRELILARRTATEHDRLALDYQLFRVEADLRWIDHTAARLRPPEPEISL